MCFSLDEESNGTQKLFALAGPLLDVLKNGRVLVVDELDTSLHPALMRHVLGLFRHPAANPLGAQLIFTTYDTSVLDRSLLRRDQVWFVEKDRAQQSRLYPLTDFHPRKEESFGRGDLQGRYGRGLSSASGGRERGQNFPGPPWSALSSRHAARVRRREQTMKTQTESKAIDLDELVRRNHKRGVSISFSGAIRVDPSKILVREYEANRSLEALERMVKQRLAKTGS